MLRFFNLFGQSAALNALDDALRASGVHPLLVPDAVKLTLIKLNTRAVTEKGRDAAYGEAAQILAYCMLGRDTFSESNGTAVADQIELRVEAAIEAGDSVDAKHIMLALHSGLAAPEIADRFDLDAM